MNQFYRLKDNTQITVRNLSLEDVDASLQFFLTIPQAERNYLRSDVSKREHIEKRIQEALSGKIIRRVVMVKNKIVSDGSLEILRGRWRGGTGYLRLVVLGDYKDLGAAYVLAWNLYNEAYENHLNKIVTKLMRPQKTLISVYEELGFKREALLPNYVTDQLGNEQDMVIMVCALEDLRRAHAFVGDWIEGEHTNIGAGEM